MSTKRPAVPGDSFYTTPPPGFVAPSLRSAQFGFGLCARAAGVWVARRAIFIP